MASTLPALLKAADINRFVLRASQIEKAKPAVAYWCNYWIVQQIVTKSLHNVDDESKAYTTGLMDKLEQMKNESANDDAVMDDVAGKALIEQFGLDVFKKAENAMRASKASRQTADTFSAGATFLELLGIWPPIDAEIAAKIKFAKYHALRIAKALKAGEDPNLTNPSPEPSPAQESVPALDPNDPEVQALGGFGGHADQLQPHSQQANVEDVPDEHDRLQPTLAHTSTLDESLHPSRAPSVPPNQEAAPSVEDFYQTAGNGDVSPLGPESADRPPSVGGGYFPQAASTGHAAPPVLPQAPPDVPGQISPPIVPPQLSPVGSTSPALHPPHPSQSPHLPQSHPSFGGSAAPPPNVAPQFQTRAPSQTHFQTQPAQQPFLHQSQPQPQPPQPSNQHPSNPAYRGTPAVAPYSNYTPDEDAVARAQKHARWAISALNFEDVKTAISELEGALKDLRGF